MFNPYNSYSWTSCLFSTLTTIKEILKESLKQWTYNTHTIASKLKKTREMLLPTLEHNQHDVIDVIWKFPVWNVKIRCYLASCTVQVLYNLTKIKFQGKLFNYFCVFVVNMTCRISLGKYLLQLTSGNVLPWDPFRLYCFRALGTKTFEILFVMVVPSARLVN